MPSLIRYLLCALVMALLAAPTTLLHGVGLAPGERLPHIALTELNRRIAGAVQVQQLRWEPPSRIAASGITLLDTDGSTVLSAERLEAELSVSALSSGRFHITRVQVHGLRADLSYGDRGLNLQRACALRRGTPAEETPVEFVVDRAEVLNASVSVRAGRVKVAELEAAFSLTGLATVPRLAGRVEVLESRWYKRYQLRNFVATPVTPWAIEPAEMLPGMDSTQLDIAVHGDGLRGRADMASIVVDLHGRADLHIGGTLHEPQIRGGVDIDESRISILGRPVDVEVAAVDLPERIDQRVVPRIELRGLTTIEPAASPTGAELPVVLSVTGDLETMLVDISAEDVAQPLSRVDLMSLIATGRSTSTLLGESHGDVAVRQTSTQLVGEVERAVERRLERMSQSDRDNSFRFHFEPGSTDVRTGLRWEVTRRLQVEGEGALYFAGARGRNGGAIPPGALRQAVRARMLLADQLPVGTSLALEADLTSYTQVPLEQNYADLKLRYRLVEAQRLQRVSGPVSTGQKPCGEVLDLIIDHPLPGEVDELCFLFGAQTAAFEERVVERSLLSLGRYRSAKCRRKSGSSTLRCTLETIPLVRKIVFESLPWTILREDLDKRIFLRPGRYLDLQEPATAKKIARQQKAIARYLLSEGVFGAAVDVQLQQVSYDPRHLDLHVAITKGDTYRVGEVWVEGAGPVPRTEVIESFRPNPFRPFNPLFLRRQEAELERYYREERNHPETQITTSYTSHPSTGLVEIAVKIRTGPHLQVRFTGDLGGDETVLQQLTTFAQTAAVDDIEVERSRLRIEQQLQKWGHFYATVRAKLEHPDSRHVVVEFDVTRGPASAVVEVVVEGEGIDTAKIQSKAGLLTRPRVVTGVGSLPLAALSAVPGTAQRWLGLDTIGRAVSGVIEGDRTRLLQTLERQGFPESEVAAVVEPLGHGKLRVRFVVQPGPRFLIERVVCLGNQAILCRDIRAGAQLQEGKPFWGEAFEVARSRVLALYAKRGFVTARAAVMANFDFPGKVVIGIWVEEGVRKRLRGIAVDGAAGTNRDVIGRELGLNPGSPLAPVAAEQGQHRLRRTGVFTRVAGRYHVPEASDQDALLQLSLEERGNLTLDTALNFSTSELLGVEMELRDRNLLGLMVLGEITGRYGYAIGRRSFARGEVAWPRIWGGPATVRLGAGYDLRDQPTLQPLLDSLRLNAGVKRMQSLEARLGLELALNTAVTVTLGYEIGLHWRALKARIDDPAPLSLGAPTRAGVISSRIQFRRLDNPFNPRKGFLLQAGTKLGSTLLGGEGDYLVLSTGGQTYTSFWRFTLAANLRGRLGFPFAQGGKYFIPQRDLLIAGGDRTVRGHPDASIGPVEYGVVNPGLVGVNGNLELRTLLVEALWIGDLQWALFTDGAYAADTGLAMREPMTSLGSAVHARSLGVGVGSGLRYVTAVGPFALDWAVDPFHFPDNRIHLMFGYTF